MAIATAMLPDWKAPLISVAFVVLAICLTRGRAGRNLPPSVPGLPFLGNTLQLVDLSHLRLVEWNKQYGPIYTLNALGSTIVVIGSASIAANILDTMSTVTSHRPRWIMGNELMARGNFIPSMNYGDKWRKHRRGSHEALRFLDHFVPVQEHEALLLVRGLASREQRDDIGAHLIRLASSVVWRILYGGPPLNLTDEDVLEINYIARRSSEAYCPGGGIVDIFPFLNYLPTCLAPFKQYANKFFARSTAFFLRLADEAIKRRLSFDDPTKLNFCTLLNGQREKQNFSDEDIAWICGSMFIAGSETTSSALHYFVFSMVLHPHVAKKARDELDMQVGDRLPTLADRDRLPYIEAIVKESLRWRPVAPAGGPHVASEDVICEGYSIPKGTIIVPLVWSIYRDPELFDDPDEFRPERFVDLDSSPKWQPNTRFYDMGFGYGRRICNGQDLAMDTMFIAVATLLWAFEFHKAVDEHGNEITPPAMEFHIGGGSVGPKAFPCKLVLRSADILQRVYEKL